MAFSLRKEWTDYEDMPEYGYDWAMAPYKPRDPEYRQSYAQSQTHWLEQWCPRQGSVQ